MAITTVSSHVVSVNAIQGTLIADNAITAVHIATNAVSGTLIADNAVTATHIAQNTITVTQLADDAVEADKIADGVITTNHLNSAMISSQTEVTPVAGDFVLLGDTSDSNNLKKAPLTLLLNSNVDISTKLNLSGGTLTGNLIMGGMMLKPSGDGGSIGFNRNPDDGSHVGDSAKRRFQVNGPDDTGGDFLEIQSYNSSGTHQGNVRIQDGHLGLGMSPAVLGSDTVLTVYDSATPRIKLHNSTTGTASSDGGEINMSSSDLIIENREDGNQRFFTNGSERVRIHGSGCVGVGSTSDRSLGTNIGTLVVNGSAGGGLWLSPGDSSAMTSKIYAEANGSVGDLIINNGTGVGSGGMRFQTNAAQKMMLDSAGRLLINQTSSNLTYAKLQVSEGSASAGHGGIVGFFDTDVSVGTSNVIQVLWFSGDDDATGGVFTRFRDGNSIMGQIEAANGTQVSYGVSSDERLKENIVDASSQLNTIKNIKVREFDWKANGYHEVGMIAQELHTVVPSAVQEGGDDINEQPWGVDYAKLTPYLIKAVQEQQTTIESLTARIETLEG